MTHTIDELKSLFKAWQRPQLVKVFNQLDSVIESRQARGEVATNALEIRQCLISSKKYNQTIDTISSIIGKEVFAYDVKMVSITNHQNSNQDVEMLNHSLVAIWCKHNGLTHSSVLTIEEMVELFLTLPFYLNDNGGVTTKAIKAYWLERGYELKGNKVASRPTSIDWSKVSHRVIR